MVGNMATCIPFQTQLSSIMEVLVKAAVAQISKLVDDKCAFLHLEISRKETENQMLKRKLLMMESKNAQLQRGFENFMDGRTDVGSNCHHPTGDIKFPEIEDAAVSFTIKEESPDEALWSSDPTAPACPAVQYPNAANAPENPPMSHPEASRQKPADFGGSYGSGQHGLQFTIKTEKEEDQLAFRRGRCQHGGGKQHPVAADFSMDERDSQLWSSIVEGNDIDAGFPDFSSVVEEYSSTFSDVVSHGSKSPPAQPPSSQRPCNGTYGGDYLLPQLSHFQSRPAAVLSQQDKQKEQVYPQRNASHAAQPSHAEEQSDGEAVAGDDPAGTHPHNAFTGSFYPPHKAPPGAPRVYACSQCGKTFNRLHQFKLHQQSHKRKRAFWCTVCGKTFQCSSHLSMHHRTHTGEKPYGCGQCGKRFTQQSSLRVHQRTHSGERPYSCSQCGKTFILMHHLKRHRIIHTYS
ncbi:zinc finger protein 835-like isoform X1 [Cololabis saira]|uniref:zinc finger protein 835-like isoform X1 n=1 Tax=Cololabis saira TaxID=129043 RepID=UPI002AD2761D|nr:zinc finger protein 835-like isoform X1 [Cololabis saira]